MPGAERLRDTPALTALLRAQAAAGRLVGAVCAAPAVVLAAHGLLPAGVRQTCHPAFATQLANQKHTAERVVLDGHILTSQGPGTAIEFALAAVAVLLGQPAADAVEKPMLVARL
eukprot:TRINITY_DN795_c1_g1_i2.p2 TRINITY_DN795_c1_g1~~TRINITY_DN795_c1_g1_i2.p2  ORF type:complete len:127 (-),score=29.66 TRINITY_DN795_c1_g1_i2:89-433(-)